MPRTPRRFGALAALAVFATAPLGLPALAFAGDQPWQPASTDASASTGSAKQGAGVEPGTIKGGKVTQLGWWSRSNEQAPETGLLAPPSLPMVAAPEGSYPVARIAGEAERITAIGFSLKGPKNALVKSVRLSLRESEDPTGSPNASAASITACPMTELTWIETQNGPWVTRPTYDCDLGSVSGSRSEDGVWNFDLTSLAFAWLAEDREFAPAIVLVSTPVTEDVEPPAAAEQKTSTFQVAFDATNGLGLIAKTGKAPSDPGSEDSDGEADGDVEAVAPGATGSGGVGIGGGDLGGSGVDLAAPIDPVPPAETGPVDAVPAAAAAATEIPLAAASAGPLPWHAGIGAKALLAVPALLIAYLVMVAMGPSGQPVVGGGSHGVSRALDRLATGLPTTFGRKAS